ncbi:MFS transporter [Acerihabitans arboris]|uniref:MFS transporter n=1 Tax=Acerihabitans arboris TaxID=2691583 RepID=A0A845SL45_9GAMM|nr:MFS transporter [Acerihabitans arboris]NDL66003.1 MFS transporter [Acerihabitans arboris]
MKGFPPVIRALLVTSLILTIGRGLTLPFIAIYLSRQGGMQPEKIGLVLGAGLTLGIVFSLYGGYLVDRFNKNRLILCAMTLFALAFFLLPLGGGRLLPMIALVALVNSAYALYSITLKACIAEWLTIERRIKAFSANYTLVNVGWAIGPPLSVMLAKSSAALPFYLSGVLAGATALTLALLLPRYGRPAAQENDHVVAAVTEKINFRQTVNVLRHDKRLIFFTLGGILASLVGGQFASCISQYLMVAFDADFAYRVVGLILPVNAVIVITLQYMVSRNMRRANLMPWLTIGSLFFIIGLLGMALAGNAIPIWMIAVAIFSLGEIIITPVEYLVIDFIAPPHLKGSYYGVQSLDNLGGAANPLLTGIILAHAPPVTLFLALMGATLLSLWLFRQGFRHASRAAVTNSL